MDLTRAELTAVNGADRDKVLQAQIRDWSTRLRDVLEDNPAAAKALRGLVADLGAQRPAVTPGSQHAHADHGSQAVTVGNISGNTGEVNVGVGKVVKRKTNVVLAPFMVFTVVLGAGAVTGWRMHWLPELFAPATAQPLRQTAPSQNGAVTPGGSHQPGPRSPGQSGGIQPPSHGKGQVPPEWGFALDRWVDDPVGTTHELSASNGEANWTYGPWRFGQPNPIPVADAKHLAIGRHQVLLPDVGAPGGIVQVSVYDYAAAGAFCQPVSWHQRGVDEAIEVACFDRSGQAADMSFATLFLAGNRGQQSLSGARGFVYAASPTTPSYTPGPLSESNAGAVTRTGTGRYTVTLTGGAEAAQVSAVGSQARHCALTGLTATTAAVACTTAGGTPADTAFTLSYTGRQSLLDDRRVPQAAFMAVSDAHSAAAPSLTDWWLSKPGAPAVTRTGIGRYTLHMPIGQIPSYTHVTSRGGGYCNVVFRNDYSFKDNATFYIACFTGSGDPADNGFDLTYMTGSPFE